MSVVVAIKQDGVVYIGCDSQVTRGGTRRTLSSVNNYKVWKVLGVDNVLMAHTGSVKDACAVRTMEDLITEYDIYRNRIEYGLIVNRVYPEIIDRLQHLQYLPKEKPFDALNSSFLFAYKDKLFELASDGSVIEHEDYVTMGSGEDFARGSLSTTEEEEPNKRIIKAIKASASGDIYVNYPIILTNTENCEFIIVTEDNEKDFLNK